MMSLLALLSQEATISTCPQLQCFTTKDDFLNSKRFARYIAKLRVQLSQFTEKHFPSWEGEFSNDSLINWIGITYLIRFEDFYQVDETNLFKPSTDAEITALRNLRIWQKLFPGYYEPNLLSNSWFDSGLKPIVNSILNKEANTIAKIVDFELQNIAREWITWVCVIHDDIDQTNYQLTLPEGKEECYELLIKLADYTHRDIERVVMYEHLNDVMRYMRQQYFSRVEKELENNQAQQSFQTEEIIRLKEQNQKILKHIEVIEAIQEEQPISIQNENQKGYAELERKYKKLKAKYDKIKRSQEPKESSTQKQDEKFELNNQIKISFIMDSDDIPIFQQKIIEKFPNAQFIKGENGIPKLNSSTTDLVVILTKFIRHSTYYGVKNEARKKEIPCIQVGTKSVELITNEIKEWQESKEGELNE